MTRRSFLVALAGIVGCTQSDLDAGGTGAVLDREYFACAAHAVLLTRCAFTACHGDPVRPLRLYWSAGTRVAPALYNGPTTVEELAANYAAASAFARGSVDEAWLVRKPLDWTAGGYFHRGATMYAGGDVFASDADPGYQVLAAWVQGAGPESCPPEAP